MTQKEKLEAIKAIVIEASRDKHKLDVKLEIFAEMYKAQIKGVCIFEFGKATFSGKVGDYKKVPKYGRKASAIYAFKLTRLEVGESLIVEFNYLF